MIILVGSEAGLIFGLGLLKKVLSTLSNFELEKVSFCSFMKSGLQSSQGLVQLNRGPM